MVAFERTLDPPMKAEVPEITAAALDDFHRDGFTVIENAIDPETLEMLREECATFVAATDRQLESKGRDVQGITHRGKRYFIGNRYRESDRLWRYVYGPAMQAITTAFLGESVYLFNEQWVVKGAEQGMKFAWHQDSGYVKFRDPGTQHAPYLTCWAALDDMSVANGTISVLPHDVAGSRDRIFEHEHEPGTNDLIGYRGDEPGKLIEMGAGGVAVFQSTSLHRSGPNHTNAQRRVYLTQYAAAPIYTQAGELWGQAVPFIDRGMNVYDQAVDFGH